MKGSGARKICIIGTGYVGLVTGTCLAHLGNQVVCLDVVREKIEGLRNGKLPIYEPGLDALVARSVASAHLSFTTDYAEALDGAQFVFIAVPTPSAPDSARADMRYVEAAAREVARHLDHPCIVVNKSTMPVGSGDVVSALLRKHMARSGVQTSVVSNPEFLREGSAVRDFLSPDRVVLGSSDRQAAEAVAELYMPLRAPIIITDLYTAEMIKYAANAFLATKISFINEIARICERLGADVKEVAAGMGYDTRIGRAFLDAGLGYGGSCFGKDVAALTHMAADGGLHPQLLAAVAAINADQRRLIAEKVGSALGGDLAGKRVAILGLAFKPNTDDMRDAPSVTVVEALLADGAVVRAYDPIAHETAREALAGHDVTFCDNAYDAVCGCDAAVIVTEWAEFRELDFARLRALMARPILVDSRNLFEPAEVAHQGFAYHAIGRPYQPPADLNGADEVDAELSLVTGRAARGGR
ncbi:MAG TPA: UDP-glucose/GDP-mannose dehydrogenase family protein [Ktedonobacterales bacterium]